MATKDKQYTGADIQALSDRDHVRLRTQIYLGSMHPTQFTVPMLFEDKLAFKEVEFIPAAFKAVGEVIDNAIDEFHQITSKNKTLTLTCNSKEGRYTVSDNGRGIPIDTHATGVPTPQVALGSLKAGRNFTDDKAVGVIGQNGVGAACTNYCSAEFEVTIHRDKQRYYQRFVDGAKKVSKPTITAATANTGTQVSFKLDPNVFGDVSIPEEVIHNRAIEIALTNPDVTVVYNDKKYRFKKGFQEYIDRVAGSRSYVTFTFNDPLVSGEVYVIPNAHDDFTEQMYTWVNSSLLYDGGKCNVQFVNAFTKRVIQHLEREAKKQKITVTPNDVRQGLLIFASLKVANPEYDSQAKTRLAGPDLRKEFGALVEDDWRNNSKRLASWMQDVVDRAAKRHISASDRDKVKELKRKSADRIPGLLPAVGSNRAACTLLITEGESASSQISEARDPHTIAAYALTGKINNVHGCTIAQALKMGKITDMLAAIGLVPGKPVIRSNLNYGRIGIATDADYDGGDIFTLLVNLFYQFWPDLFDPNYEPIIYRLNAPNVCLVKGTQRIHFTTRADYEKVKGKYKGYEVRYYKGLGSMHLEDWEMILSKQTDSWIPIVDDGKMKAALELLFGDDADARKNWLSGEDNNG